MNPKRRIHEGMIIAITSGGIVSLFTEYAQPNPFGIIGGLVSLSFAVVYAVLIRFRYGKQNLEQTWEENRRSIVRFILSTMDDDFTTMKPIIQKLELRGFDFNNELEKVTLEDIDQINPDIFRERFDKLPLIQNVLGFITYEQYSALYNYIKYSSLFIDSLYRQNYRKDLLQSRADETKKILKFFGDEDKDHVGLIEWKKRLSS